MTGSPRPQIEAENRVRLLYDLSRTLGGARDLDGALHQALRTVCQAGGWDLGETWVVDETGKHLECAARWWRRGSRTERFQEESEGLRFPRGFGLPGRAWAQDGPFWMRDVLAEPEFLRQEGARQAGLRTAVGIPIRSGRRTIAVLAFYLRDLRPRDEQLVHFLGAASGQIGSLFHRRQVEAIERSSSDLKQLTYVVSHDLREPLRMITSYLQLLQERYGDRLDEDAETFIGFAVDGADRMRVLLDDLLAYARSGGPTDLVRLDLEGIVREAWRNVSVLAEETNATLRVDPLPEAWGDHSGMLLVFQNLLQNSIRFRGDAPPVIEVSGFRDEGMTIVGVRDNGRGIREADRDRIFEIFRRAERDTPGTGMGLAICRRILQSLDGRIWVESERGRGSTFWLAMPGSPDTEPAD